MNQPNILLKAAVVASSLLLVGGLVFYRAGAFNGLMESGTTLKAGIIPGSMNEHPAPDTLKTETPPDTSFRQQFRKDTARGSRTYFGSSKSSPNIIQYRMFDTAKDRPSDTSGGKRTAGKEQPDTTRRLERFMGGSKSLAPLIEPSTSDSQTTVLPETSKPSKNDP